ncbi:uncharacterized protein [Palaemon carinicauda]|uniref:uncharacterized protein n=1 Tax=Palaemon carinicauda TaxID=392227 RepID=UPI0035B6033E
MAPLCKLCNNEYHKEERPPISLSCGHCFCRQCLINVQGQASSLRCPTCVRIHSGKPLSDLTANLAFLSLSDSSNPEEPPSTPSFAVNLPKGSILFLIKTSTDMQIPIKIHHNTKVGDLKLLLQIQYGLDAHSGFFSFQGNKLEDEKTLQQCNVTSGAILHVDAVEDNVDIIKPLGKGGFGEVFLMKRNGRHVVLKKVDLKDLNDKGRTLSVQEMKLLEGLNHPNIVFYEGGYRKNECLHIFMEYCEGGDLARQIEMKKVEESLFPEGQVLSWTLKITEGLSYIHDRKIIHRDIKPANIFLSATGTIKIGDFGIARVLGDDTTRGSTMIGTAKYTAIEVMNGGGFTTKADMFSLGCTVYELAALKTNYPYIRVFLPESFSEDFKNFVQGLLEYDPDHRPDSSEVLRLAIFKDLQESQPTGNLTTLQEEEYHQTLLKEGSGAQRTISNLRRSIEEQTPQTPPKPLPRKKRAPPIPPRPGSQGPSIETCLEVLNKFCDDFESGRSPDQRKGLEDIIVAMETHRSSSLIQMKGCLSLSYITMQADKQVLTPSARGKIVDVLVRALTNYPKDWDLRASSCQAICQFARPIDLLLRARQLVPQLLKLMLENNETRDPWSCLYALHLVHILSSRVGEEYRIIMAHFGTMEVVTSVVRSGRNLKYYDEMYKFCWAIICQLTDDTPINCERFVASKGLSFIQECLSAYPDPDHQERRLWFTLCNISEVKTLRGHLQKPELLYVLMKYLNLKSIKNEMSWEAAKILVHILSDGEESWILDFPRSSVIQKIEEAMNGWDLDSKPKSMFKTLKPFWLLLVASHTPVCQHWATWTLAKLTRVHRDKYCPVIVEEGGLIYLQKLIDSVPRTPKKPYFFPRAAPSAASPQFSFSTLLLALQVKHTCEDYLAIGIRNRDLVMKLFVASSDGHLEDVDELIKAGVDLNIRSSMSGFIGRSSIHLATENGHSEVVCALLDGGAYVDKVDAEGRTALHIATLNGRLDLLNVLHIYGSDLDAEAHLKGWKVVHFAAVGGHIHILEFLSEKCDLGELTKEGKTSLHLAAEYGRESVIRWLLTKELDPHQRDAAGYRALDYAMQKGWQNIVAILTGYTQ